MEAVTNLNGASQRMECENKQRGSVCLKNDITVSYSKDVYKPTKTTGFNNILNRIQSDTTLKHHVNNVRKLATKKEQQDYKEKHFPWFNMCLYKNAWRANENLVSAKGLIFDCDHLDENKLARLKRRLKTDENIFAYFTSPRGEGLKVLCLLDQENIDAETYSKVYQVAAILFNLQYEVKLDTQTSDAARACFLSYDPDVYVNEDVCPISVETALQHHQKLFPEENKNCSVQSVNSDDLTNAVNLLLSTNNNGSNIYNSYHDWQILGLSLASLGEEGREHFVRLSVENKNYSEDRNSLNKEFDKLQKHYDGNGVTIKTLFYIARQHGFESSGHNRTIKALYSNTSGHGLQNRTKLINQGTSTMLQKAENAKAQQFTLQNLKEIVNRWLLLESDQIVDVIMGTYLANQLNSDPLWLLLIAPPSNAKTELLRALGSHEKAFFISTLTPATLISGLKTADKNPSLIFQLNDKVLILKDFTSILAMRSENQQEILSQLREIYDGQYSKGFGFGNVISWTGKMGLIAACTPVYDKHHATISALGDRFLLYRSKLTDPEETGRRALEICGQEEEMRDELQEAFKRFLDQFNLESVTISHDEAIAELIVTLGCFCAAARCAVERDRFTKSVDYVPQPEGSPRLVKQLLMLGSGIAIAQGKNGIDKNVYKILKDVALSLIPANRRLVIQYLCKEEAFTNLNEWRQTAEIADAIGFPRSTTIYIGEDLTLAGLMRKRLLNDQQDDDRRNPYQWQLTVLAHHYITSTDLFSVG